MLDFFSLAVFRIMSWSLQRPKLASGDFYFKFHHELIDLNIDDAFQSKDIC